MEIMSLPSGMQMYPVKRAKKDPLPPPPPPPPSKDRPLYKDC